MDWNKKICNVTAQVMQCHSPHHAWGALHTARLLAFTVFALPLAPVLARVAVLRARALAPEKIIKKKLSHNFQQKFHIMFQIAKSV